MKPIIEIVQTRPTFEFHQRVTNCIEEHIYRSVVNVGVNVDKERLIQALEDARAFYDEGYADGKAEPVRHGRWEDSLVRDWRCSECGEKIEKVRKVDGYCYDDKPNYCPNCGVKMV